MWSISWLHIGLAYFNTSLQIRSNHSRQDQDFPGKGRLCEDLSCQKSNRGQTKKAKLETNGQTLACHGQV